jgi:pimeloyl-ACP methyl ester carboxylesterase
VPEPSTSPTRYADVAGIRLRYVMAGAGPALVLLHTLRTQLELVAPIISPLARHFTVYAPDHPGHGHSDAPKARYDATFFAKTIEGFLDVLDLKDVTLAGVSIGGVIPLMLAARRNPRLSRVIAINPYDYARGLGLARSSAIAFLAIHAARVPVLGEIMLPLTPFFLTRAILAGGVAEPRHLPRDLALQIHRAGQRPGHVRAFLSLLRNAQSWQDARDHYPKIDLPVLLIWGEKDWSRQAERDHSRAHLRTAATRTIAGGGHFLPLDRPRELAELMVEFARNGVS